MQDDTRKKKERRRSSIMVVEKSGQQDEVLKATQDEKASDAGRSAGEPGADTGKRGTESKDLEKGGAASSDSSKEKGADSPKHKSEPKEEAPNTFDNVMNDTHNNYDKKEKKGEDAGREPHASEENRTAGEDAEEKREGSENEKESGQSETAEETGAERSESRDKKKAVGFAEERNTEHEVGKDADKSIPADVEERNVKESMAQTAGVGGEGVYGTLAPGEDSSAKMAPGCEIEKERQNNNIVYEGTGFKRRWLFYCFWVQRYFVMTKDGIVRYYRSKNKQGSVFMKASELDVVSRVDRRGKHPYQIVLSAGGRESIMAFDSSNVRDAWTMKLSEVIRNNRDKR